MVFRETQVCGTIPQLLGVCWTCNSNIFLYDLIKNSLFYCYNDFSLHLEILWIFFKIFYASSLSSNLLKSLVKVNKVQRSTTHGYIEWTIYINIYNVQEVSRLFFFGLQTEFLIITRNFLQESIDSKSKDSKIPSIWSSFMFSFQYDLNDGVTHKWSYNHLSLDIFSITVINVITPIR
jgi:hypothetical protein